ncbi:MAG TPA: hypothetical protein VFK09_07235 [Gemmatimonadales bacterium]|nr:hypothetical protein [Gemmatimonadales bacterium]
MIATIWLHHVLREAVATPYRNLVTRSTGAAVRGRIEAVLAGSGCRTAVLDFSEVACLDFSCADEIVAKLLLASAEPGLVVVLRGVRDDLREAIEHVLIHHRLAVAAWLPGGEAALLGWASDDARAAFAALLGAGGATASDLAERLGWTPERAHAALADLEAHRLAGRAGDRFAPLTPP